jgi:transcriptional regulator with XRE-family HTH domain
MPRKGRPEKPQWDEPTLAFKLAVGQIIKKTREAQGISTRQLGAKVGLSHPQVSNIEHGNRELSLPYLYRIAEALEVSVADLLPQQAPATAEAAPDRKAIPAEAMKPG